MDTATAIKELRKVSDECIDNYQPVNVPDAMGVGDMLPQGDIGLLRIESVPRSATVAEWPIGGQLAPGNTQGSRHCIPERFRDCITVYSIQDGDDLSDTVLEATEAFDLTHPEHADHIGYPPGVYRVRHQQTAERQRVID